MNLAMLFSWRVESLLHISNEFEYQPIERTASFPFLW